MTRTPLHRKPVLAVAAAILLIAVAAIIVSIVTSQRPRTATPFAPDSIWNAPLPTGAPVGSDSAVLVNELNRQVASDGTWINSYAYSTPVYTVPGGQGRVPVRLGDPTRSTSAERLARVFAAGIPIPANAVPAPGTDGDMVIWQPSTDTMWELWIARHEGSHWTAEWGGKMSNVSNNPGYFTSPSDWGTAATSLALLGGTITPTELRSGHIGHALSISIPEARAGVYASPAQRTDGKLDSPAGIPEGTRFRLDPSLNIAKLGLPPVTRMLAYAAQRYGLFVRDQSGVVAFYAEQTPTDLPNPYYGKAGLFAGLDPKQITEAFPWSHLEVVRSPLHPAAG